LINSKNVEKKVLSLKKILVVEMLKIKKKKEKKEMIKKKKKKCSCDGELEEGKFFVTPPTL
jgi:hypothetical protein